MMNMNRVAFDDNDRAAMRKNLLSSGLSEREVETMDAAGRVYGRVADPQHISNMMGGGAGGRQIGGTAVFKRRRRANRSNGISAYSSVDTMNALEERKHPNGWWVPMGGGSEGEVFVNS